MLQAYVTQLFTDIVTLGLLIGVGVGVSLSEPHILPRASLLSVYVCGMYVILEMLGFDVALLAFFSVWIQSSRHEP